MAAFVEFFEHGSLELAQVTDAPGKDAGGKLTVCDAKQRTRRVPSQRVLLRHTGAGLAQVGAAIEALVAEVDIALLWESVHAEETPPTALSAITRLYFDTEQSLEQSAILRAAHSDRAHFKVSFGRDGIHVNARSASEVEQVHKQLAAEKHTAEQQELVRSAWKKPQLDQDFVARIMRWLRGGDDRFLASVFEAESNTPGQFVFNRLLREKHVSFMDDLEVIQADLHGGQPAAVAEYAKTVPEQTHQQVEVAQIAIDDAETREVDDAISVTQEGDLTRVDIDIADASASVAIDDPIDVEARKRITTVYLPTKTYYMLPERIGCDVASLQQGKPRRAVRTSVWLDQEGQIQKYEHRRCSVSVGKRLDYDTADQLIRSGEGELGDILQRLNAVAVLLRERRRADGALFVQRPEWKLSIVPRDDSADIKVIAIDARTPSRQLVGEMMVLANHLAARTASEANFPLLYRTQSEPGEPLPELGEDDELALIKLRGLIKPASLSLNPGRHWGLGLDGYTQITSPLRRYSDLMQQRQLCAHIDGHNTPYSREDLQHLLANVEATEQAVRRVSFAVTHRWSLEYVKQLSAKKNLEGRVIADTGRNLKVRLTNCGADGLLSTKRDLKPGDLIRVDVDSVQPRKGLLRLRLSDAAASSKV